MMPIRMTRPSCPIRCRREHRPRRAYVSPRAGMTTISVGTGAAKPAASLLAEEHAAVLDPQAVLARPMVLDPTAGYAPTELNTAVRRSAGGLGGSIGLWRRAPFLRLVLRRRTRSLLDLGTVAVVV